MMDHKQSIQWAINFQEISHLKQTMLEPDKARNQTVGSKDFKKVK